MTATTRPTIPTGNGTVAEVWTEQEIMLTGTDLEHLSEVVVACTCGRIVPIGECQIDIDFQFLGEVTSVHCGCRS